MSVSTRLMILAGATICLAGCATYWPFAGGYRPTPSGRLISGYSGATAPLSFAELQEYEDVYLPPSNGSAALAAAVAGAAGADTDGQVLGATTGYSYTASDYALTPVGGDSTVRRFYYIRQDHLMKLVPPGTDPTVIERYNTFGPHPIGAEVNTRIGFNYYFFPVCGQHFAPDRAVEIRANEPPPAFELTCRR